MPLFTPSESYALQSFLEHIDISGALEGISSGEAEWPAIYSAGSEASAVSSSLPIHYHSSAASDDHRQVRIADEEVDSRFAGEEMLVPRDSRSEQLAKAAKDLMSLDSNPLKWADSADHDLPCSPRVQQQQARHSASPVHQTRSAAHARSSSALSQTHFASSSSSSNGRPRLTVTSGSHSGNGLSAYESLPSGSSVNSSDTSPPPLTPPSAKRPYDAIQDPSSSSASSSTYGVPHSKKARPSSSHTQHNNNPNVPIINTKPTLLSTSQKKANHIQSEQKRRANIRRGYEALCDTVPALREAIRREEEEHKLLAQANTGGSDSAGKVKKKLRARRKVAEGPERMDGRAGPRSENIVLSKSEGQIFIQACT